MYKHSYDVSINEVAIEGKGGVFGMGFNSVAFSVRAFRDKKLLR